MDSDTYKEWWASCDRRKRKKRSEKRLKILVVVLSILLVIFILIQLKCLEKGEKFISRERAFSAEEWSYYASLKNKSRDLEEQQARIKVYERLLEKFANGKLSGYTQRDSVIWTRSSLELKRKFNQELRTGKYNSLIALVPKLTDPEQLPKGKEFSPLPTSFMPYKLSEQELQEALQNPQEWVESPPDSTEEQKEDAP